VKSETIVERGPAVRCYECGSTRVLSLCHHCMRPMCVTHSRDAYRQSAAGPDGSARPISKEFAWLKQSDPRRGAVYHCEEHDHRVSLMTLLFRRFSGLWTTIDQAALPPLPVFPHVNTVEIVERLSGQVSFVNGKYLSTVGGPITGEISFDMSSNGGRDWLRRYRKKYRLPEHAPIRFTAGSAMIKGTAGLRFAAGQDEVLPGGTGIAFSGETAAGHPLFDDVPGHPPGEWILTAKYEVQAANAPRDIPLWIVPSVVPSSDRKTLEIDLHWNDLGPEDSKLNLARFELVELEVPKSWGSVQAAPGGATIDAGRKGRRVVSWRQLPPRGDSGATQRPGVSRGARSRTLRLSFENAVLPGHDHQQSDGQANAQFTGTLTAIFERPTSDGNPATSTAGTLSGVEGVDVYLPGGGQARQQPEVLVRTEVTVGFNISLDAIRYQEQWAVPKQSNARQARETEERQVGDARDGQNADDVDAGASPQDGYRKSDDTFLGVIPDFGTVAELTNLISKEGYYVKCVVEQDPLPGYEPGGEVIKRVWDIAGRWYDGVVPIGFDINLRGEEFVKDAPLRGRTIAQVTVNGAYANDPELTQQAMIEKRWDDLHDHVTSLLRRLAANSSGMSSIAAAPSARGWDDDVPGVTLGYDGTRENRFAHEPIVVDATIVEEEPLSAVVPPDDDTGARKAALMRQWQEADDAVIAGRVKEETHARIVARIQGELRRLEEQS